MDSNAQREALEQLHVVEKMLRSLEQLGRDPAACKPELVIGYAIRGLHALQIAESKLDDAPPLYIQA